MWTLEEEAPKKGKWQLEDQPELTEEESQRRILFPEGRKSSSLREFGSNVQEDISSLHQGLESGLSFGLSKQIRKATDPTYNPEIEKSEHFKGSEMAGSLLPLTGVQSILTTPLRKLAEKSPVLMRQAKALANITGSALTGAAEEATKSAFKGEVPSADDLIEHGALWGAVDAGLQALGWGGRFAKALFSRAQKVVKPEWQVLNDVLTEAKISGSDISSPDRVAAKAMSILDKEPVEATAGKELLEGKKVARQEAKQANAVEKDIKQLKESSKERIEPEALQNKKIEKKVFDKIDEASPELAEVIQPESIHPNQLEKELGETSLDNRINRIGPKSANNKEFGAEIQKEIETGMEAARKEYKPLYDKVKEGAKKIEYTPIEMAKVANETLQKLQSLKTKPAGYDTVIKQLENVLEDIGYIVLKNPGGRVTGIKAPVYESTNVGQTIELGRRLNEIINYDVLDRTIKDQLRPLARLAKSESKKALAHKPKLLQAFEQAETKFGEAAQKYGRESVTKIRKIEAAEGIDSLIKSPTALEDLRKVLSPEKWSRVERQILEHMREMSHVNAQKYLNEISPQLSSKTRETAQKFVRSKLPRGKEANIKSTQEGVFDELADSFTRGVRPDKTLKLWKTVKGQDIVRKGLKNNPNAEEIIQYLEKQSINDFAKSVVKPDGKIDFKKFNELMKDKAFKENLKLTGGQEAVSFFENLEKLSSQIESNAKNFEKVKATYTESGRGAEKIARTKAKSKIPSKEKKVFNEAIERETTEKAASKEQKGQIGKERLKKVGPYEEPIKFKLKEYYDTLGIPGKTLLGIIGLTGLGIPKGVAAYAAYKIIYKMATSKTARNAFMKAAGERTNPLTFIKAIDSLDENLED